MRITKGPTRGITPGVNMEGKASVGGRPISTLLIGQKKTWHKLTFKRWYLWY